MALATHYPLLDPLRAIAALAVLVFHVLYAAPWPGLAETPLLGWLRGGWVGVDIFFVISGLVVGKSALSCWMQRGAGGWMAFARNRALRILPLYLLTCALYVAVLHPELVARDDWGLQLISHLSFTHNWWTQTAHAINPPTWSLGSEVQLYLLLVVLTPLIAARHPAAIASAALLVAVSHRSLVMAFASISGHATDDRWLQHLAYQMPGMLDSFGLGVAIAVLCRRWPSHRWPRWTHFLAPLGLACLAVGALTVESVIDGSIWSNPAWAVSMRSVVAIGAALLVLALLRPNRFMVQRRSAVDDSAVRNMALRIGRHGGDLSYGIYLWHALVLDFLLANSDLSRWSLLGATLAITCVLAELSWRGLERPLLRRWRHRHAAQPGNA